MVKIQKLETKNKNKLLIQNNDLQLLNDEEALFLITELQHLPCSTDRKGGSHAIIKVRSNWMFLPSQVKSWMSTSWIGISFKKKGLKQRGFPLTILFFLNHFPSQAKWQLQLKELASKLLKWNKTQLHQTWTFRNTEITTERWWITSQSSFLPPVSVRSSSVSHIGEALCRFYTRTRVVIKIYIYMHIYLSL